MHFDLIYIFKFSARSKVIKGVKRSNSYFRSLNCTGQKPKQRPILFKFVASCVDRWLEEKSQRIQQCQRSAKGHYVSMTFFSIDWHFLNFFIWQIFFSSFRPKFFSICKTLLLLGLKSHNHQTWSKVPPIWGVQKLYFFKQSKVK